MSNPEQLFQVGEEVILCSKDFPHLSGDAVVIYHATGGSRNKCPHCRSSHLLGEPLNTHAYFLNIPYSKDCCRPWSQSSILKKYRPGQSFNQLIESLKTGVDV